MTFPPAPQPSLTWQILGGNNVSRIGMNSGLCVYQETNSLEEKITRRFLFDAGTMSCDPRKPEHAALKSSDTILVDYDRYLYKKNDAAHMPPEPLDGIFLTHNHSDHMGALPFLALMGYRLPVIYATPYTAKRLEQEFSNLGMNPDEWPEIKLIAPGMTVQNGPVKVSPFWVSHSTPHCVGFFIETPCGNILNPGDFKLDQTVMWGPAFDPDQFKKLIENKPIDLLLLDSTGADRDIMPTTEHDMREALRDTMQRFPDKRFVIAVMSGFEENVASIAKVTAEHDRTLWVCGWSHEQSLAALKATGLSLSDSIGSDVDVRILSTPKSVRELDAAAPEAGVLILTGAQGSPHAALTKAAEGKHPAFSLNPETDIILFCAPVIPGQEAQYARLQEHLKKTGVPVMTRRDAALYPQAHARLPELLEMLELVQPKNVVPIHGDTHLRAAAAEAYTAAGYDVKTAQNGDHVNINRDAVDVVTSAHAPQYVGMKLLQGTTWNDRHYLITRTENAVPANENTSAKNKKPKMFEIKPKF